MGEAVGGRKRRAEWRTAGPNIAAYLRDSALAPDLGSAPALPRAGRGLHGRSRIPHSGRTNKAPFDGRHLFRVGHGAWGGDVPPTRDHYPDSQQGAGRSHLGRAGGAGVACRCTRGRRRRAGREARGPAYRGRWCPLQPQLPPRALPGCAAAAGERDLFISWRRWRHATRVYRGGPVAPRCLPCSRWWTRALPASAVDSLPQCPASAVLICPQLSGFSSSESLCPLYLEEDVGGPPVGCSVFF